MDENATCYEFKELNYNKGFYDDILDATYIIHLRNNGRLSKIYEQLVKYQPTKIIYIVFNDGFKKCKKSSFIKNPPNDLVDANLQILKHSKKMNYNNILILEDDFIFNPLIKEDNHINNIKSFIVNNTHKPVYYLLGCEPILQTPYSYYHYRPILSGGTHSVIYNTKMIDIILSTSQEQLKDWDDLGIWFFDRYTYYIPLCYQLFPKTENSQFWGADDNFFIKNIKQSGFTILHLLNMDVSPEPGFTILYIFSKILCIILLILFIFIFISIFRYLTLYLNKRTIWAFFNKTRNSFLNK